MKKVLSIFITGVVLSFFYFPFSLTVLPSVNTKMVLALFGVMASVKTLAYRRQVKIPRSIIGVFIYAAVVSLVGLASITYNNTPDTAYASYIVSMTVWLSAAYAVCVWIKRIHGNISYQLLCWYIIGVCAMQCILAIMINFIPSFQRLIDTYIFMDQAFLHKVHRLYGIGASLDVAGIRFSIALIMAMFLLSKRGNEMSQTERVLIILAFLIIVIIGSMIARTTYVGVVIGGVFVLTVGFHDMSTTITRGFLRSLAVFSIILAFTTPVVIYEYSQNSQFRYYFRFGFEGFVSLIESGEWEISSNDKLKTMYVYPDNPKTWIIGDGYFDNPVNTDIDNYIGTYTGGYYKNTDVGYLRFIFYFGLIGLFAFSGFIIYCTRACAQYNQEYGGMLWMICLSGFVIWFKVATDVFLALALFICAGNMLDEDIRLTASGEPYEDNL